MTINTRINLKHDTEANWDKQASFIPGAGEIIIYDIDGNYTYPRVKIGDGSKTLPVLPFINTLETLGLPTVSIADNGKFMRVSNGTWAAITVPNAEEDSF